MAAGVDEIAHMPGRREPEVSREADARFGRPTNPSIAGIFVVDDLDQIGILDPHLLLRMMVPKNLFSSGSSSRVRTEGRRRGPSPRKIP